MADGHLIFDTKLDQKGFVKGIKNITSGITSLAGTIKALTDRAIASFNKISAAYVTQIEAEARLSATMRNSTSATKEQIQSVKDLAGSLQEVGVVGDEVQLAGAQELATYVSSVESVKKILPVLDDMIAQQYGFSASTDSAVTIATMLGKVLQGQTSALSRYGYKFDEAQEKLLKYGTEEQRVATLAAVVEESVSGVNKALANTPTGKVKQLSNDFGDLKETVGKMLTDVLYPVVTVLDELVKKLNVTFTSVSNKIRELMGITDSTDLNLGQSFDGMEDVTEETAQNVADMADSAEQAERANKENLSDFDELNVLSQPESTDDSTAEQLAEETTQAEILADQITDTENRIDDLSDAAAGVDFSFIKDKIQGLISVLIPMAETVKNSIQTTMGTAQEGVEQYLAKYSDKIGEYSERIKNNLKNTTSQTSNGIENLLDTAIASQERMGEKLTNGYTDMLGGASIFSLAFADVFSGVLDTTSQNFENWTEDTSGVIGEFFDGFNENIANAMSVFGGIFEGIGTTLTEWWDEKGAKTFDNITQIVFDLVSVVLEVWNSFINPIIGSVIENIQKLWGDHLQPLWENILELFSSLGDCIATLWNNILRPVIDWVINSIAPGISVITTTIVDVVSHCVGWIIDLVSGIIKFLQGVVDFITGVFSGDIEKAFEAIETMAEGIAMAIINTLKFIFNLLIDGLNLVWGAIYTVVKGIVDVVGNIAGAMGDLFGMDWNFSVPAEPPKIPRLATGTVVPANYGEFTAVLGDNKRDPEIVSPIPAMKQAFLEALAESGITGGRIDSGDIIVQIDGREVFRAVKRENDAQKRRHGGVSQLA